MKSLIAIVVVVVSSSRYARDSSNADHRKKWYVRCYVNKTSRLLVLLSCVPFEILDKHFSERSLFSS